MDETQTQAEALRAVREEVARLSARVAALEAELARAGAAGRDEPVDERIVAVLAAAVAAYLGTKPRIRGIRVLSSPEWARSGRAHIQASHVLGR